MELFQPSHLIIVLVIALFVFGGKKLPELGKGLGEGLRGFKDGMKGVTDEPTSSSSNVATRTTDSTHVVTPKAEETKGTTV